MSMSMNLDLWKECKRFLSFRDLCATRPVCKEWMDIRSTPFTHFVYFFADGSNVNLPDSDDPNFRKCILAAQLTKLCQVFDKNQLDFILQTAHSVRELIWEYDGSDIGRDAWDPRALSWFRNLRKLELCVSHLKHIFKIDFKQHAHLNHVESNVEIEFSNYDKRPMSCFGLPTCAWTQVSQDIASHSKLLRCCKSPLGSTVYCDEWRMKWANSPTMDPEGFEIHRDGMTFYYFSRDGEFKYILTVAPIFGIQGSQHEYFIAEYREQFHGIFSLFPNMSLEFHKDCDDDMKQTWLRIINPARKHKGLPPLSVAEVPVSVAY